jgi:hypothetical protein
MMVSDMDIVTAKETSSEEGCCDCRYCCHRKRRPRAEHDERCGKYRRREAVRRIVTEEEFDTPGQRLQEYPDVEATFL